MRTFGFLAITALLFVSGPPSAAAQAPPPGQPTSPQPELPPATKLEGFKPAAGSVVIFAYDELGRLGPGFATPGLVSVDVRQMRDPSGSGVRGLFVEITESQYRKEGSFVDEDEIPELLKGLDALLEVKGNPSAFKNFEVRYTTRGELRLTAYNNAAGKIQYSIEAGRLLHAHRPGMDAGDMAKLRDMFNAAEQKLTASAAK